MTRHPTCRKAITVTVIGSLSWQQAEQPTREPETRHTRSCCCMQDTNGTNNSKYQSLLLVHSCQVLHTSNGNKRHDKAGLVVQSMRSDSRRTCTQHKTVTPYVSPPGEMSSASIRSCSACQPTLAILQVSTNTVPTWGHQLRHIAHKVSDSSKANLQQGGVRCRQ